MGQGRVPFLVIRKERSMYITYKNLQNYQVVAKDAVIGAVEDVYFNKATWQVSSLYVCTSKWLHFLPTKHALLTPDVIESIRPETFEIFINLKKQEVMDLPVELPAFREKDGERHPESDYYAADVDGYRSGVEDVYWAAPEMFMFWPGYYPYHLNQDKKLFSHKRDTTAKRSNIMGCRQLEDYVLLANDGKKMNEDYAVQDFMFRTDHTDFWKVTGIVTVLRAWGLNYWPVILFPTTVIEGIDKKSQTIKTNISRKAFDLAPEYRPADIMDFNTEAETKNISHFMKFQPQRGGISPDQMV